MASSSFTASTSMDVPQTQNTAPVLEFRCLYTSDLRRKQKRWQDGRLKFHTFNKRVMVYDERSNFVGDTHWREDAAFDEGEEFELERGGILVEVGEFVGKRDQDLSELVDKRVKEREERAAAKGAAATPSRPHASLIRTSQATPGPLQHKPLNVLLATTGHYGRAVIPQTSPFEEKQRLINGNQDGVGKERPAKRRKPNEDAPSKSGYAQNLMGATLSLASSRPLSTATIFYEPVIARPNARDIPTPTIDLTGDQDEDEEKGIGASAAKVTDDRVSGQRRGKDQRRLKRSSVSNGYASNLTGASLTLSRPESLLPGQSTKILPGTISTKSIQGKDGDFSSELEEESSVDTESLAAEVLTLAKPSTEATRKLVKSSKRNPRLGPESSSPPLADAPITKIIKTSKRKQVKSRNALPAFEDRSSSPGTVGVPMPKPTRNLQNVPIEKPSAATPTPEQSASVLRIKARPPRKMMMLLDRPSSRSSSTVKSLTTKRQPPKHPQNSNLSSNEVVLSQATMHLDAFCQRQEEIIQARLDGKRSTFDLEDLLSSPEDKGIDHQTIDLILSRKSQLLEKETVVGLEQPSITSQDPKPAAKPERSFPEIELNLGDVSEPQPKAASSLVSNSATNGPGDGDACPTDQNVLLGSNAKDERGNSSPSPMLQDENSTAFPTIRLAPQRLAPTNTVVTIATKEMGDQTVTKTSQGSPKMSKLPDHFSSAIQAATDHFRALIKSSASSGGQWLGAISSAPEEKDHAEQIPSALSPQEKEETSSELVAKPSPSSSTVGNISNNGSELLQVGSDAGKASTESFGNAPSILAANGKFDSLKARLVNPATRGKSLQTIAANTVDSLAPAFSLMPPPPAAPWITSRPQRNLGRNFVAEERPPPGGYTGDRTMAGPWSRESYDLFGSWLPPGTGSGGLASDVLANNG
jgi:hypothetical protein